jgi:stearoyl-CoA desaturase (delta-9 desaturase)
MKNEATINQRGAGINWGMTVFMIFFHAGAVAALFVFTWPALMVAVLLWWIVGSLGIGMGYHRLLTHRGYKVPKPVEYFLTICGALALEGGTIPWVTTHRVHHAFTDLEGDPHSPRDGRWWSHMGWILTGRSILSSGFMRHNLTTISRYVPDLARQPFHIWLTRLHWLPSVILALALFALGGWPFVIWGIFLRVVFSWHATWLVNSATHIWGSRRFATRDDSRNLWWVALVSFGEGWHNNHHAHPAAARHGLAWYELDVNWYGIRALQFLGLARAIRLAKISKPVPAVDAILATDELQDAA